MRIYDVSYVGLRPMALALLCILPFAAGGASTSSASPKPAACGLPVPSGPLGEPPQIEVGSLSRNDRGNPELILRVVRQGDRFCYRYTRNGQPEEGAPILRVHRGETFAIRLVNELQGTARGATLAASALQRCWPRQMPMMAAKTFTGYMNHTLEDHLMAMKDVDANLHLHGFQGPPEEENIFLSTLSTPAHACEYVITVPRTQPPGTYFYHTHAHGMSDDEVAGGLGGMWIVEPDTPQLPREDERAIVIGYRVPFVLTDNFLSDDTPLFLRAEHDETTAKPAAPVDFDPFNPPAWPSAIPIQAATFAEHDVCGNRSGVAFTIDGTDTPGKLTVPSGQPQLLRVLNATPDSPIHVRMRDGSGAPVAMHVVGRDGNPVGGNQAQPLSQYVAMNEVTLPPSGRADMLVTLEPNQTLTLYGAHSCLAPGDEVTMSNVLLSVRAGAPAVTPATVASAPLDLAQSPAARLLAYARAHPHDVRRRAITYTEYVLPRASGKGIDGAYYITETSAANFHEHTYWPMYARGARTPAPDIIVKRGSIEEWDIFNATMESHSFHIHQMSFVALDHSGPVTLDTVWVPFGKMLHNPKNADYPLIQPSRTRVLLDFRNVPRGTFVFHCHMLFHEDRGMMGVIKVV